MIYNVQWSEGCLQNFKSIHAKLKKDRSAHAQLHQAMIYKAARVRRLSTNLQVDTRKTKKDRSVHAQLRTL